MPRFQTFRCQAENIQGGESEYNGPENVVDVSTGTAILESDNKTEQDRCLAARNGIGRNRGLGTPRNARQQRNCRGQWHNRRLIAGKPVHALQVRLGYYPFFCGWSLRETRLPFGYVTFIRRSSERLWSR